MNKKRDIEVTTNPVARQTELCDSIRRHDRF